MLRCRRLILPKPYRHWCTDTLQRAESLKGLSHDMLVHIRMKRNVFVLNSRRLQRLAVLTSHQNDRTRLPAGKVR